MLLLEKASVHLIFSKAQVKFIVNGLVFGMYNFVAIAVC